MKKNITLQKLSLLNFKGIKNLSIDLDSQTDIYGANGTGKTTLADAFTWLLFGKDTTDRKDFEIKTLDANGKVIPMIDHEVSAFLLIDNEPLSIRRVLKENWVKKRGSETAEFSGNVTELYWNDVPMSVTEFTKKVNDVLNEQVFKMITSPTYFNSIPWKDRRNLLIDIFGEVSNEEVAKGNSAFENLVLKLNQGKTLEEYNAQIKASIKKAKEDLKGIPARIDEVFRGKPEAQDFRVLEIELETYQRQLDKVDLEISDLNKSFDSKLEAQRTEKLKHSNLKSEIEIIEQDAKNEANKRLLPDTSALDGLVKEKDAKKQELDSFESALKTLTSKKQGLEQEIKTVTEKMNAKREEWQSENSKEISFNDKDFHCPTCKREFESGDVETKKQEAISNFNLNKTTRLNQINTDGGNLKTQKENLETELKAIEARIETELKAIETAKKELQKIVDKIDIENSNSSTNGLEPQNYENLYASILALNNDYQEKILELETFVLSDEITIDNSELVEKRKTLVSEIDTIKTQLQTKTQIEAADKRIAELKQEETTLSQQIANVEKEQFVIENFIKAKVDALENIVNSKFKYVKFKMFDTLINGGVTECCDVLVNGVPYKDCNTASKINAGIDVINELSKFYQISAPIFLDNRESVTEILKTESQIINLFVVDYVPVVGAYSKKELEEMRQKFVVKELAA